MAKAATKPAVKAKAVDQDVLLHLSNAECRGTTVFLNGKIEDRALYLKVNKVLEGLGGKWDRKAKGHVFEAADVAEKLEMVKQTGLFLNPRDMGFFPTSGLVLDKVMELARVEKGMTVLEPSAGTGNIAERCKNIVGSGNVICCEIDKKMADDLRNKFVNVFCEDFLEVVNFGVYFQKPHFKGFDRVVMNPPFASSADILHVNHAWTFLRPGGRLVSVMAAGVSFRAGEKYEAFRNKVVQYGGMTDNPPDSFKAAGTSVRTVTVWMDKPKD